MYRFHRTATIRHGADTMKILAFCGELNGHVNQALDLDMKFGMELFNAPRIHWSADFASLAEFEEKFAKLMANMDYWAKLDESRDFWVEGSLQDSIFRVLG